MSEIPHPSNPEQFPESDPLSPLFSDLKEHLKYSGEVLREGPPSPAETLDARYGYYRLPAPQELLNQLAAKYDGIPLPESSHVFYHPARILPGSDYYVPDQVSVELTYRQPSGVIVTESYCLSGSWDPNGTEPISGEQDTTYAEPNGQRISPNNLPTEPHLMSDKLSAAERNDYIGRLLDDIDAYRQPLDTTGITLFEAILEQFKTN